MLSKLKVGILYKYKCTLFKQGNNVWHLYQCHLSECKIECLKVHLDKNVNFYFFTQNMYKLLNIT